MIRHTFLCALFALPAVAQQTVALGLTANGQTETTLYRGWPLLLEASAFLVDGDQASLDWPAPLKLTITNARGEAQTWPLENLAAAEGPVVLLENQPASNVWGMAGDATAALPDGDYTLLVEHSGADAARRVLLTVAPAPASPSSGDELLKNRLESRLAEFKGDLDGALAILDAALLRWADDIGLYSQRADVLEALGRFDEAAVAAAMALAAFGKQFPNATHPPRALSRRVDQLLDEARAASAARRPVPRR